MSIIIRKKRRKRRKNLKENINIISSNIIREVCFYFHANKCEHLNIVEVVVISLVLHYITFRRMTFVLFAKCNTFIDLGYFYINKIVLGAICI